MKFVLKDTDEWFGAIFSPALYGGVAGLVLFFVLFFAGGERVGSASNALFEATRAEPLLLWISGAGIAFLFTQKCRDRVFPAEAALQAEQRANERAQFVLAAEAKRSQLLAKEKADKDAFSRIMVEIRQKEFAESAQLEAMQLSSTGSSTAYTATLPCEARAASCSVSGAMSAPLGQATVPPSMKKRWK